jgi:hypothetical protein
MGLWVLIGIAWLLPGIQTVADSKRDPPPPALQMQAHQTDFIWNEPILVTLVLTDSGATLPPGPQQGGSTLRFEFDPPLSARSGARPLPTEAAAGPSAQRRDFDLLEWFEFPQKGGIWEVTAVLEAGGTSLRSKPMTLTVRKPGETEAEGQAAARLHHIPWSNYDTDKFCGDTFDLVEKWPESRLAKYAHYWNGRYLQNQREYGRALASFRKAAQYDGFALKDDAEHGASACLEALQVPSKPGPQAPPAH